jgi:hypothetical protein
MLNSKLSTCGRFVVLNGLNLDRCVFKTLERWAAEHELQVQDAIQFALCALTERGSAKGRAPAA